MINLTDKAKEKIKEISDSEGIGHYTIRVKIVGFGCAGMGNSMDFDNQINESDQIFNYDSIQILVDELSFQYMDGTTIDYKESDFSEGFVFNNPNITGSCGCGKSVSF